LGVGCMLALQGKGMTLVALAACSVSLMTELLLFYVV